jgi:hypothetical protein
LIVSKAAILNKIVFNQWLRALASQEPLHRPHEFPIHRCGAILHEQHAGARGNDELASNATSLTSKAWPSPVIDFYLGRRSQDEMMAAATKDNDRCEAQFYLGEWQLLNGNREQAIPFLRQAEATCPIDFPQYTGAVALTRGPDTAGHKSIQRPLPRIPWPCCKSCLRTVRHGAGPRAVE